MQKITNKKLKKSSLAKKKCFIGSAKVGVNPIKNSVSKKTKIIISVLVSFSLMFYKQILRMQIPKAQKILMTLLYFLCFWDLRVQNLLVEC